MASNHQPSHIDNLRKLWANPKYSDLTVECQGRRFKVHKAIVCQASGFFRASEDSGMREHQMGVVQLRDFDYHTIERALSYVYTQDYTVKGEEALKRERSANAPEKTEDDLSLNHDKRVECNESDEMTGANDEDKVGVNDEDEVGVNEVLLAHVNVCVAAHFLQIPDLATFAVSRFKTAATYGFEIDGLLDLMIAVGKSPNESLVNTFSWVLFEYRRDMADSDELMAQLADHDPVQRTVIRTFRHLVNSLNQSQAALDSLRLTAEAEAKRADVAEASVLRVEHGAFKTLDNFKRTAEHLKFQCTNMHRHRTDSPILHLSKVRDGPSDRRLVIKCDACQTTYFDAFDYTYIPTRRVCRPLT